MLNFSFSIGKQNCTQSFYLFTDFCDSEKIPSKISLTNIRKEENPNRSIGFKVFFPGMK